MKYETELYFPVYEFRPLITTESYMRFNNGNWIADDGEYDLCFISNKYPLVLGVGIPYHEKILWSWCKNGNWGANVRNHPNGNAWHYMTKDGSKSWHSPAKNRDNHPNVLAFTAGMNKCSSRNGVANGHRVDFHVNDKYILNGLVRDVVTKEVLTPPEIFDCIHCGKIDWKSKEKVRL